MAQLVPCSAVYTSMFNMPPPIPGRLFSLLLPLLALLCPFSVPPSARAEFFDRGPFTLGDGSVFVVSLAGSTSRPGLFVVYPEAPLAVQMFDPEHLPPNTEMLFLEFDYQTQRFTKIILPQGKEYAIDGGVTFAFGDSVRVGVDGAYCSVVSENRDEAPAVVGFVGPQKILQLDGLEFTVLVEANRHLREQMRRVGEYQIKDHSLTFQGKSFEGSVIGVRSAVSNPCLSEGSVILKREELEKIRKISDPKEKKQQFQAALAQAAGENPLEGLVIVNITSSAVTAFDYVRAGFVSLKSLKKGINNKPLCVLSELPLE